ncbi:MAG: PEGA domain-containing protein [Spirochaetales bacterium]|nr:PEGA domain-containing protein [Spirochaetales bacterium]
MKNKLFVMLAVLSLFATNLFAQQNYRVAVLPFSAVGVSESEAKVLTSLFETALVKTGVYQIIEQNQMKNILEAQAYSLSGCTDDACAVEVGKLLSAELIIIGELSNVGERYIANAKIINVESGSNVNADSVSEKSLSDMTDNGINLLAYKLAGLTYSEGSSQVIADAFGEIFIETIPNDAEIFVNGMLKGKSPLVISKVPLGTNQITAKKGNLSGETAIKLTSSDLKEIKLLLSVKKGRLFIKCPEKNMEVFIDGKSLGKLSSGLFKDIDSGEHILSLQGPDSVWENKITIEDSKTLTVEAYPSPFGNLHYILGQDAEGVLLQDNIEIPLSGTGDKKLTTGNYKFQLTSTNYKPFETDFSIEKGQTYKLNPILEYTDQYKEKIDKENKEKTRTSLSIQIAKISQKVHNKENRAPVGGVPSDLYFGEAERIYENIRNYKSDFPELEKEMREVYITALEQRIDELDAITDKEQSRQIAGNVSRVLGISSVIAGAALTGICYALSISELKTYSTATTTSAAVASRETLEKYSKMEWVGVGTAGVGALTLLWAPKKNYQVSNWKKEIIELSAKRARLEL